MKIIKTIESKDYEYVIWGLGDDGYVYCKNVFNTRADGYFMFMNDGWAIPDLKFSVKEMQRVVNAFAKLVPFL